ncbi:AlpA family transcriptional regulator [Vibrio parahaemolyticus]|uniref:helix-turn-helix transcriptional regulator n=1 Tax=Vibrio parahaemolyticus TaxID=670 RepID=UPI001121B158|nr:AlpA family transcriptional regulator [Vibrio parahaemolyticus]MDS1867382.1 AlpA family transcriptional regulator [Vibrio parahaemolyticus]QUD92023.1 AlpA family transcriptional regulator [Vibrio parahaemolyticus]TOJ10000.1 transcriptional regulator [Vibrio parahaemolyticus]HCG7061034.1 AlpA family transcriptional regulator [Vibrio parahaemolyticus]HCG8081318.1 AlpA family transcriptional regulator [Vibrio parahaemolyticus]
MHLLNLKEVIYLTGLKRSSIYKFMDEGHFPKSVSIGGRSVMWSEEDIQNWIEEKIGCRVAHGFVDK